MKVLLVLCLVCACIAIPYTKRIYSAWEKLGVTDGSRTSYQTFYFPQILDHFDFGSNPTTFQQRYLVSGNEGDITLFWDNSGFVTDTLAKAFGGLVIFGEHRYYGNTLPFGNQSLQQPNVAFLSSEQALYIFLVLTDFRADYAVLLTYIKQQYNAEACPVIAFGGSYGGMLSSWFRLKYPNIVAGAVACSAPILQFENTGVSQWIFNEIVTRDFQDTDGLCGDRIHRALVAIQTLGNSPSGIARLNQYFKFCQPLKTNADAEALINWVNGGLTYEAMIDYPYPTDFLEPVPAWPVNQTCAAINSNYKKSNDVISALVAGLQVYFNFTGQTPCFDLGSTAGNDLGDQAWDFQSCSEMVMPIGSNGTSDMFLYAPWSLDSFIEYCETTWNITPRPHWITTYYGGALQPDGSNNIIGSNIVFSNGNLDPWSGGGVTTSQPENGIIALFIEQGAHHLDLRLPNSADPLSVQHARAREIQEISKWIKEYSK